MPTNGSKALVINLSEEERAQVQLEIEQPPMEKLEDSEKAYSQ